MPATLRDKFQVRAFNKFFDVAKRGGASNLFAFASATVKTNDDFLDAQLRKDPDIINRWSREYSTRRGFVGKTHREPTIKKTAKPRSSKYRGVTNRKNKIRAQVHYAGASHYIGSFETEEAAARAYDTQAIIRKGPAAILNFPAEHKEESCQ